MTAIWDKLGGEAYDQAHTEGKWNPARAQKVQDCMRAVYMCIKNRPEYHGLRLFCLERDLSTIDKKLDMLETFKTVLESPLSKEQMSDLADIAQRLHDFDHKDTPTEFGPSYGHHTEVVIGRKRANKQYAKLLYNIHYEDWWAGGNGQAL